jgi:hypothetical protein
MTVRAFPPVGAAAGLLFVVLWIVAGFVADLPAIDAQPVEIADYFDDEHVAVVTSVCVQGLALACFFFFLAGLAVGLGRSGEQWLAATQLGAGVVLVALLGEAAIVLGALAWRATDDPSVAQSLFDLALLGHTFSFFPLAALVAATGLALLRSDVLPRLHGWGALAAAAVFVVAGATYGGSGFFAPGGGYSDVASLIFLAWVAATSGLMLRVRTGSTP